jgi:periplasmic copper chaperone A
LIERLRRARRHGALQMSRLTIFAAVLGGCCALPFAASAHITLEKQEATVGGGYKAVFRVPHGCAGSPTVALHIRIPEGVINVKPQPKAGWQVAVVKGKYEKSYTLYGNTLTEGVKQVDFTGGNLSDDFYDEFVLNTTLAGDLPPNTTLYFPVVQDCVTGTDRWIEIPEAGKSAEDYENPAPGLKLIAK